MSKVSDQQIKLVFDDFDSNGDGKIQAPELRKAMEKLGRKLSEEEVKEMVRMADVDGDGEIDFDEFKRMMQG